MDDSSSSDDTSDEDIEEFFEKRFSSQEPKSDVKPVVHPQKVNYTKPDRQSISPQNNRSTIINNNKFGKKAAQRPNQPQKSPVERKPPKKQSRPVKKPTVSKKEETNTNHGHFEPLQILITGLNNKTTADSVSNYIELLSNEDVTNVTLLENGNALVLTNEPIDFVKCSAKVTQRTLNGSQPRIEQVRVCNQILVSGLASKTTHDAVELYFENPLRGGGHEVQDVDYDKQTQSAVVTFKNPKVVDVVVSKQHNLDDHVIIVQKYYPGITPRPISPTKTKPTPPPRRTRITPPEENPPDEDFPDMEILGVELLDIEFPEEEISGGEMPDMDTAGAETRGVKIPSLETPGTEVNMSGMETVGVNIPGVEMPRGEASSARGSRKQKAKDSGRTRECVEVDVEIDVMQFINGSKRQRECLDSRLGVYKAELEWQRGDETARIYKKQGCGYVKKWSDSCRKTLTEFLDKFEKVDLKVAKNLQTNLPAYLRANRIHLSNDKGTCRLNKDKSGLIVVCLEEKANEICAEVRETLSMLEQEEVKKAYKNDTVTIEEPEHLDLLQKINFVGDLKRKHAELEIKLSKEKRQIYFEGPKDQFSDAKIKYFLVMHSVATREFAGLPSPQTMQIALSGAGRDYIKAALRRENMQAVLTLDEATGVKIVAVSTSVLNACEKLFLDLFMQRRVPFDAGDAVIFENNTWRALLAQFQENSLLNIELDTNGNTVNIQGVTEYVKQAEDKVQQHINYQGTRTETYKCDSNSITRLLDQHCGNDLREIEKEFATKIEVDQQSDSVVVTGTRDGVKEGLRMVASLCDGFVTKKKIFSNHGEAKLLLGDKGKRYRKVIETDNQVIIDATKTNIVQVVEDGVEDEEPVEPVPSLSKTSRPVFETTEVYPPRQAFSSHFSSTNMNVTWKFGHIEGEKADVLVNSATSNLQNLTACGKALYNMGGPGFTQACQPHTNVPAGSIVTTTGGSLACGHVIHAVCRNWDNGAGPAQQLLCTLLGKIFNECDRIKAKSLALPLIGCGGHHYPEAIVAAAYDSEISNFATGHPNTTLKEIRVIVYRKNAQLDAAITSRIQGASTAVSTSAAANLGNVNVTLHQGDVATQPFAVDATVNILDSSRKLANGGGINQALLRAGGATIQTEIDSTSQPGAILVTSAGNIQNIRHIFHIMPSVHDINNIESSLEACFREAQRTGYTSISVPALGTAGNITPIDSAKLIMKAAGKFSRTNYALSIHIVVFQPNMMQDFNAICNQHKNIGRSASTYSVGTLPVATSPVATSPGVESPRGTTSPRRKLPKKRSTRDEGEAVELTLYSSSHQNIANCLREVDGFLKDNITSKEIEHESAFEVADQHWSVVKGIASALDVHISVQPTPPLIKIRGQVASVADCQEKLNALIISYTEDARITEADEVLHQAIGWCYTAAGSTREFSKTSNGAIERAHINKKGRLTVIEQGVKYQIDLGANTRTNVQTGVSEPISRKKKGAPGGTSLSLPQHWAPQPAGQVVHLVQLSSTSSEYQRVHQHFINRGGQGVRVVKIERIQNPVLYKNYITKKQAMSGGANEMQLFHGTNSANCVQINTNNFNRSYAGINGTAYGNGVYFARDSSYSLGYAQNRNTGAYSTMYVAKVLVGKFTRGASGMKAPPSLNDPNNPGLLYDTVVNHPSNPTIFVIFLDHQCYPEYLISFT